MIKSKFKKIIIGILLFLLVLGLAYVLFIYLAFFYPYRTSWVSFDSNVWKNAETEFDQNIRYRMHRNLLKKYPLIGMSENDLTNLLGHETLTDKFQNWDIVYWMDTESGAFAIDNVWLLIDIEDSKVLKYKVTTD